MAESKQNTTEVLIIDDDSMWLATLAQVVEGLGYRTILATSGEQGLRTFKQRPTPIVLTDFNMPGLNGLQVAASIKAMNPSTAVIMITGTRNLMEHQNLKRVGVDQIFYKPFRLEVLADCLRGSAEILIENKSEW